MSPSDNCYWKVTVERPLRLHSQLTHQAIETLRFASGVEEIRAALYEEFGDALFTDLGKSFGAIETRLSEWGADDDEEESESENGGNTKKGLTDKKKKDFGF